MTTDPTPETTMTTTEPTTTDVPETAHPPIPPEAQLPAVRTEEQTDAAMAAWGNPDAEIERQEMLPTRDRWAEMEIMANRIARSPLVPAHIRSGPDPEGNMMVILLAAHDLGLNATTAFQKVHVIEGKPALSAELMRTLIRRDGHDIWSETQRDERGTVTGVTWFGVRKEQPERVHQATFTTADATLAGLLHKDVWKKYPEAMLSARATSKLAREVFPDCLAGVSYTPEELNVAAPLDEPPPSVSIEEAAALQREIDAMTPEIREIAGRRWKEAQIGALKPGEHTRALYAAEVDAAWIILRAAKDEAPVDAEIVGDGGGGQQAGNIDASRGGSLTPASSVEADSRPPENVADPGQCSDCAHAWDEHGGDGCDHAECDCALVNLENVGVVGRGIGPYAGQTEQVDLPPDGPLSDTPATAVVCPSCGEDVGPDDGHQIERHKDGCKLIPAVVQRGPALALPAEGSGTVPVKTDAQIRQEVADMSLLDVSAALREKHLSEVGAPKALRKRLADFMCNEEPF